jgi:hypothetical protein
VATPPGSPVAVSPGSPISPTTPEGPVKQSPTTPEGPPPGTSDPVPAAATGACAGELGDWTGEISNATIAIPRLGGTPMPLTGSLTLTLAAGDMPGTLHGTGTLTAMVLGFPASEPIDFTAPCGPTLHAERELKAMMLGKVKLTLDGTLALDAKPASGKAHFSIAGIGMMNMGLSAQGDLTLDEK